MAETTPVVYNENPASPDYAPDPLVGALEAEQARLARIKFEIENGVAAANGYTDAEIAAMLDVTNALDGRISEAETLLGGISSPDVQAVVGQLTSLLDLNEDGDANAADDLLGRLESIDNNLTTIAADVTAATQAAAAAQASADQAQSDAAAAANSANAAAASATNAGTIANQANAKADNNASALADLQAAMDALTFPDTVVDIKAVLKSIRDGATQAANLAKTVVFEYSDGRQSGPMPEDYVAATFPA